MKKRHQTVKILSLLGLCAFSTAVLQAQSQNFRANQELAGKYSENVLELLEHNEDSRERFYYYEVLHPVHEKKPLVTEGWATVRYQEKLDRGLIAQPDSTGKVHLGWRLLQSDDPKVAFNVFRTDSRGKTQKINKKPVSATTDFVDTGSKTGESYSYYIKPLVNGKELSSSEKVKVTSDSFRKNYYRSIKLQGDYQAQRVGVTDLNGDGSFDFVILQGTGGLDPGGMSGNTTGATYKLEAYLNDGTCLWRKDLGLGLEPGVWYTPFVVYDFDGDGRGDVAVKTGPNDVREADGRVRKGAEWVSVLDGMTGNEKARADWPERNPRFGGYNRTNRNQMGMAFLDGKTPCILVARGTYKLMIVDAYQLKDRKLQKLWRWDGDEENPVIRSQGAHSMVSADIDDDGRDEIILGSAVLDDNGTCLYSAGIGHTDKTILSDIDPSHPGLEIFHCAEQPFTDPSEPLYNYGVCLINAKTGEKLWGMGGPTYHVGSGIVADIDPSIPGMECCAREDSKAAQDGAGYGGRPPTYILNNKGKKIDDGTDFPGFGDWVYWDADLLKEAIVGSNPPRIPRPAASAQGQNQPVQPAVPQQRMTRKSSIAKYKGAIVAKNIEGSLVMPVDIEGDWREELIASLPGELRIYTTTIPAKDRRITLMQDPLYRNGVLARTMGYTQHPLTSYYLGE